MLGTPTKTQVAEMNPEYDLNDYKFPKVKKREWKQVFPKADPLLLDLISQVMIYSPKQRLNASRSGRVEPRMNPTAAPGSVARNGAAIASPIIPCVTMSILCPLL